MKPHHALASVLLTTALCASPTQSSAQSFYPLICHGGGDMLMSLSGGPDGDKILELKFQPGQRAYSPGTLYPGECTWADRALSRFEPTRIYHLTSVPLTLTLRASEPRSAAIDVPSASTDWPTRLAKRFITETRKPDLFTVWVRNTGAGYFEISNIRAGD